MQRKSDLDLASVHARCAEAWSTIAATLAMRHLDDVDPAGSDHMKTVARERDVGDRS